jgi:prepilin-type N-terminal cleavage/methylation domain-containing protein
MKHLSWTDQSGLTLTEVMVAIAILLVGLLAVVQAFPVALQGMETGRQQSTGVFLAEQKIEQIKAWALSTASGQGFTRVADGNKCCQAEGYQAIAGYPHYRRVVFVTDPSPTTKVVRVQTFYRPVTSQGVLTTERSIELSVLLTTR